MGNVPAPLSASGSRASNGERGAARVDLPVQGVDSPVQGVDSLVQWGEVNGTRGGFAGTKGGFTGTRDARKPQNPAISEEYHGHLQGVLYSTRGPQKSKTLVTNVVNTQDSQERA
eukprot:73561-Pyramimonas_sp.AAC.1